MPTVRVTRRVAEQALREVDWKKLERRSDARVEWAARTDRDNPPPSGKNPKRLAAAAMIRRLRKRIGLIQAGVARRYKVPVAPSRDGEQGRRMLETTVIAHLKVIDRMPEKVHAALAAPSPRRRQRTGT